MALPKQVQQQESLAKQGDVVAMYSLALYYLDLADNEKNPQNRENLLNSALPWLLKASQKQYIWAFGQLAMLSAIRGNDKESKSWYEQYGQLQKGTEQPAPYWQVCSNKWTLSTEKPPMLEKKQSSLMSSLGFTARVNH